MKRHPTLAKKRLYFNMIFWDNQIVTGVRPIIAAILPARYLEAFPKCC